MFKHESEFSVTAAQTFVFRLSSLSVRDLHTDIIQPQECFSENLPYFNWRPLMDLPAHDSRMHQYVS